MWLRPAFQASQTLLPDQIQKHHGTIRSMGPYDGKGNDPGKRAERLRALSVKSCLVSFAALARPILRCPFVQGPIPP